jgi:proline iminopeptidase
MALTGETGMSGLSPAIIDALVSVFSRYPQIEKVVVFGSRARHDNRSGSDIDLAVFAPDMDETTFARLWNELDELPIAFKMDVVHFDRLESDELRRSILRHNECLYLR